MRTSWLRPRTDFSKPGPEPPEGKVLSDEGPTTLLVEAHLFDQVGSKQPSESLPMPKAILPFKHRR